ncbi:MAG: hypothetical protein QOG67_2433 [Verrucomicrobiota bacterium]|jgi:SAM-dependent methyltransferase
MAASILFSNAQTIRPLSISLYVAHPMASFCVQLSHKIRKLFSIQALQSLWEHLLRSTHPVNVDRILSTIDRDKMNRLREHYPHRPGSAKVNRFENANHWIPVNVERAQDLWLDRASPLRILDLGCGAGYFLYVSEFFGHEALGLDTDDDPLFRGTTELLNVRRIISRIEPGVPLPDLDGKFDLVTAHRICFQRIARRGKDDWKEWPAENWKFFINDIRTRFLRPEGRLLLDFNPHVDGSYFTPDVRACFQSLGGRFFRSKVLFAAEANQRAKFKCSR